jgi:type I restriction enzyme, S subunit
LIEAKPRKWSDGAPSGWKVDRLKDCMSAVVGGEWGDDPGSDVQGRDLAVLRVADFTNGSVEHDDLTVRRIKRSKIPQRLLTGSSLLVEKSGGGEKQWVGRVVHPGELPFDAICSNFIAKLEVAPTQDAKFLNYIFSALYETQQNRPHVRQTTGIQNLALHHYLGVNVSLPPLPEQKRIAAYLDSSCAAIDLAIENKQKQIDTLDALRKSIISSAVLSGLSDSSTKRETGNIWIKHVPAYWKVVALKRLSQMQTGITLGKKYEPPLIERPYLRAANVQDGHIDLETITTIEIPEKLAARYELETDDVLMTEGGDLDKLGRGFPWEGQIPGCLHQNHVFAIRTNRRLLLPKFLAYLTASSYGRDYFEATGKRTTNLASTNSTKVGLLPIPLPPIEEQQLIVKYIDAKIKTLQQVDGALSEQTTTLRNYRKSLIHEYVTGKRRLTESQSAKTLAHV